MPTESSKIRPSTPHARQNRLRGRFLVAALTFAILGAVFLIISARLKPDPEEDVERVIRILRQADERGLLEPIIRVAWRAYSSKDVPQSREGDEKATVKNAVNDSSPGTQTGSLPPDSQSGAPPGKAVGTISVASPKIGKASAQVGADLTAKQALDLIEKEYSLYRSDVRWSNYFWVGGCICLTIGTALFIGLLLTPGEHAKVDQEVDSPVHSEAASRNIAASLLARSADLRTEARQFITFIFLLAIGGALVFQFAGEFAFEKPGSSLTMLDKFQMSGGESTKSAREGIDEVFQDAIKEAAFAESDAARAAILQMATVTTNQLGELAKPSPVTKDENLAVRQYGLISSIVARVGVVVLIGYLIKILLASYRYNLRLATFYSSRAHSLMLVPVDKLPETLAECAKVLGPESPDFEKVPGFAIDELFKAVKAVPK